jgi:2-oxoglutarate ferredoxin oxidoreductase subunit delta
METATEIPVEFRLQWCKKCGICVDICPKKALAVGSKEYPELADPAACTRCKLCEMMCPDFVIRVADRPSRAKAQEA